MSIYGEGPTDRIEVDYRPDNTSDIVRYGCPRAVSETDPVTNPNQYALTKYAQEVLCLNWGKAFGVPATALRFFNVYGEGQSLLNPYTGVAAIFAACLLSGLDAPITEDGRQTRDFIHVSDIVAGLMATLHAPAEAVGGEAINLGTGRATDLLTLHRLLACALGKGGVVAKPTGIKRVGDIRDCYADIEKAKRLLHWSPAVRLEDGMDRYAQWLKTQDVSGVLERVEKTWAELREKGLVRT
jgi:dTDP-L-rhamnose 4-epimerase